MSHPALEPTDRALVAALAASARGPQRDGIFALWLVARAALGAAPPALSPARHGERLQAVEARVRTLSPAAPLRRAVGAALADLHPDRGVGPAAVLTHLVAPAAESGLAAAATALQAAARAARPAAPDAGR
jgi:hypothetical protein